MRARAGWLAVVVLVVALAGCAASWEGTAAVYAREQGFTFHAPPGEELAEGTMYQPVRVEKVADDRGAGVRIAYARFTLSEYKAPGLLDAARLEPYLDVDTWREKGITKLATVERATVQGRPAVIGRHGASGAIVFQPAEGVVARLEPWGRVPKGSSTPEEPMPIDAALAVAETFTARR